MAAKKAAVLGGTLVAGYASYKMFCPSALNRQQSSSISSLSTTTNINRVDTGNPNVFFDIEIDGQDAGRITMEVMFK